MDEIQKYIFAYRHLMTYNHGPEQRYRIFYRFFRVIMGFTETESDEFAKKADFTLIHDGNRLDYLNFCQWYYTFYASKTYNDLYRSLEELRHPERAIYQFFVQPVKGSLGDIADDYTSCARSEADFWLLIVQHPDGPSYYAARCRDEGSACELLEELEEKERTRLK